jgi:hypothetical protein
MNSKATILCAWALMISLGLFSCATQQNAATPERPPERSLAAAKEQPPPSAKAPAQAPVRAQEVKQPQGPGIVKSEKGAPYMSGGIGVEERNEMRRAVEEYNLGLSFAGKSRHYVTDVDVVISDDKGQQVLNASNTGPWFYVQLPPGKYIVKATYNGKVREVKNLRLKKDSGVRQTVYWDID